MKLNNLWLLVACSLIFVACDSEDESTTGGEMAGEAMAGEAMAGEAMAGEAMAGEAMAGEAMAGEAVAGEAMAGEAMAGEAVAGEEMAGEMTAGTMMSGICTEVVETGATCDPDNDCCARGSFCLGEDGEGTCVSRCEFDADGEAIGCGEREVCLEDGEPGEDGVTPGYCLRGDDCEPGNENLACGEGEYHCFRFRNVSLCIGDLAPVREEEENYFVGEGEECNPFGDDAAMIPPSFCEPGFTCESNGSVRVCRAACDTSDDCSDGQTCLDYTEATDGVSYKFCSPVCDLSAPDCGETGACILTDILDDVAFGTCQEVEADQIVGLGERCDSDAANPTYCAAGLSCEFDGNGSICSAICEDDTGCEEGQTCLAASDRYGLDAFQYSFCTVPCDPLSQDCADENAICLFSGIINDAPAGTCVTDATDGTAANTETCEGVDEDFNYWGTCSADNICFLDEGSNEGTCGSFCTPERADLCTGPNQACTESNVDGLGLCTGFCDLATNDGCDEGQSCIYGFSDGVGADGNDRPVGFCYDNDRIGEAGLEEACVIGELQFGDDEPFQYPFVNNCAPGHLCGDLTGGTDDICLKTCTLGMSEIEGLGCPEGFTCNQVFQGGLIGACVEAN